MALISALVCDWYLTYEKFKESVNSIVGHTREKRGGERYSERDRESKRNSMERGVRERGGMNREERTRKKGEIRQIVMFHTRYMWYIGKCIFSHSIASNEFKLHW